VFGIGEGGDGVPNPVFHHVNLTTTRLDDDHAIHRIALLRHAALRDDPDKLAHTGIHHTAFEFGSLDELLTRYETLKAHGIVPHSCLDHGLTTSFYYADPDGNNVEMQVDNFGDWAASAEWMRTAPEFVADPIGTYVDPEQIAGAARAGVDPQEIHRRGFAGEFAPAVTPSLGLPEL
jgi:catechol 2,3-dioxygenase